MPMSSKMERLAKQGRKAAKQRNHRMKPLRLLEKTPGKQIASGFCRGCGKELYILESPAPNEIDISGEAVAMECGQRPVMAPTTK